MNVRDSVGAGSGSRWSTWEAAAPAIVANFSKSHIIVGKSCPVLAPYESFQSPLRSPDRASVSLLLPRSRGVGTGSSLIQMDLRYNRKGKGTTSVFDFAAVSSSACRSPFSGASAVSPSDENSAIRPGLHSEVSNVLTKSTLLRRARTWSSSSPSEASGTYTDINLVNTLRCFSLTV